MLRLKKYLSEKKFAEFTLDTCSRDAQTMLVSHFGKRPHWSDIHNEYPLERSLCEKFDLVIIPGKRSPFPVIIPPCILSAIELLLSCTESLNICSKYIFANPDLQES